MSRYSKERIEFDYLLRHAATHQSVPNYAALHQQAQPLVRTAQLQAIASGPRHVPLHLDPPSADRQRSTAPYSPPKMGSSRVGAEDALKVPSLISNHAGAITYETKSYESI